MSAGASPRCPCRTCRQAARHRTLWPWPVGPPGTNVMPLSRQAARHERYGHGPADPPPPGTNVTPPSRQAARHERYGHGPADAPVPSGRPARTLWPVRPPGMNVTAMARQTARHERAPVPSGRPARTLRPGRPPGMNVTAMARQTARHERYGPSGRPAGTLRPGRPPGMNVTAMARQTARHERYGPSGRPAGTLRPRPVRPPGTNGMPPSRQAARHECYGPADRPARMLWPGRPPGTNVMARQTARHECYGAADRPARMLWPGRPPVMNVTARQAARADKCRTNRPTGARARDEGDRSCTRRRLPSQPEWPERNRSGPRRGLLAAGRTGPARMTRRNVRPKRPAPNVSAQRGPGAFAQVHVNPAVDGPASARSTARARPSRPCRTCWLKTTAQAAIAECGGRNGAVRPNRSKLHSPNASTKTTRAERAPKADPNVSVQGGLSRPRVRACNAFGTSRFGGLKLIQSCPREGARWLGCFGQTTDGCSGGGCLCVCCGLGFVMPFADGTGGGGFLSIRLARPSGRACAMPGCGWRPTTAPRLV